MSKGRRVRANSHSSSPNNNHNSPNDGSDQLYDTEGIALGSQLENWFGECIYNNTEGNGLRYANDWKKKIERNHT